MKTSSITIGMTCLLVIGLTAGNAVAQGGLTPPGAPSPTMKTLEQVEPRIDLATVAGNATFRHVISQPGSYYLSNNLEVGGNSGIIISASAVTLDLNGFEIFRSSGTFGTGIYIGAEMDGFVVYNGVIRGFSDGINCSYSPRRANNCLFEKLTILDCNNYGILGTPNSRFVECRVSGGGNGIIAQSGSTLIGCTVNDCVSSMSSGRGISVGTGSSMTGCTVKNITAQYAIYAQPGSTLSNCSAYNTYSKAAVYVTQGCSLDNCSAFGNDATYGIFADVGSSLNNCTVSFLRGGSFSLSAGISVEGSSLMNCTAYLNTCENAILAESSSLLNCTAYDNDVNNGIFAVSCSLDGCNASYNTGGGTTSAGIRAVLGCSIVNCSAVYNRNTSSPSSSTHGIGIYADNSSLTRCSAKDNQGDGVYANNDTILTDNMSNANGDGGSGAGIHATGSDNRIDGNIVTDNDRGIHVGGTGNLIVRNTASGNSVNYDIAANNKVDMIITPPNCGVIYGSSGGAGAGTEKPWANFSY